MAARRLRIAILVLGCILVPLPALRARDFGVGYGLVFAVQPLDAGRIDGAFDPLPPGGHSSFFFLETPLIPQFYLSMSPGAINIEDGPSQFHAQYNLMSLYYKGGTRLFPRLGLGIGATIATLSTGSGTVGSVQDGVFIRDTAFMWTGTAGLGYRLKNGLEVILELRELAFLDPALSALNVLNAGFTLGMALK